MNKYSLSIVEMRGLIGENVYWLWCDGAGKIEPTSPDEIDFAPIHSFYIDAGGIGVSVSPYDGAIGYYSGEGQLTDGGRRLFLSRENAEKTLNSKNLEVYLGRKVFVITQSSKFEPIIVDGTTIRIHSDGIADDTVEVESDVKPLSSTVRKYNFSDWCEYVFSTEEDAIKSLRQ